MIWNPHAVTPLGKPIGPLAPPVLRVMGGVPASAQQISMAQAAFARFCGAARLSFAPNPSQIGRLADGTVYQISVVGNSSFMQIWPAPAGGKARLQPGIAFAWSGAVGISVLSPPRGGDSRDSSDWTLNSLPGWFVPTPLGDSSTLYTGVPAPEPAGYFLTSIQQEGGAFYIPQLGGYVGFPINAADSWSWVSSSLQVLHASSQQVAMLYEARDPGSGSYDFYLTYLGRPDGTPIDLKGTWHDLEKQQLELPNPREYPELWSLETRKLFDSYSAWVDGEVRLELQLAGATTFMLLETEVSGKYTAADAAPVIEIEGVGEVFVTSVGGRVVTSTGPVSGLEVQRFYKHRAQRLKELGLADPSTVSVVELQDEVTPRMRVGPTYWNDGSNPSRPGEYLYDFSLWFGPTVSATRSAPGWRGKGTVIDSRTDPGGYTWSYTSLFTIAGEPISYESTRSRNGKDLFGAYRTDSGIESVLREYHESCNVTAAGAVSGRRYVRADDPDRIGGLEPPRVPSDGYDATNPNLGRLNLDEAAYTATLEYSAWTQAEFGRFGVIELVRKTTSGHYEVSEREEWYGSHAGGSLLKSADGNYSWRILSRDVKLYDPRLNLLCYVEVDYSNARSFKRREEGEGSSWSYSLTSDQALPAIPDAKLVLLCQQARVEVDFKFAGGSNAEMRDWAARLHPLTGCGYGLGTDGNAIANTTLTVDLPGLNFFADESTEGDIVVNSSWGGSFAGGFRAVDTGLQLAYLADPLTEGVFLSIAFPGVSGLPPARYLADRYGVRPMPPKLLQEIESKGGQLNNPRAF